MSRYGLQIPKITMRFLFLAMAIGLLSSEEVNAISVTQAGSSECPDRASEIHVFGGQSITLSVLLDEPVQTEGILEATLFAAASRLAAPIGGPVIIGKTTPSKQTCQTFFATVAIPRVKRKTQMVLDFQIRTDKQTVLVGVATIFVYPSDILQPLKEFGWRIGVFGKRDTIREFLKSSGVAFEDFGEKIPALNKENIFYIGEASPDDLENWLRQKHPDTAARMVIFTRDPWKLPGVYTFTTRFLTFSNVTLPLLDTLGGNPCSQETFVAILTQPDLHVTFSSL